MIRPTLLFVEMKSKDVTPNLSLEPALIEALMPKDHKSCNLVEFSCGGTWHNSGLFFFFFFVCVCVSESLDVIILSKISNCFVSFCSVISKLNSAHIGLSTEQGRSSLSWDDPSSSLAEKEQQRRTVFHHSALNRLPLVL